MIKIKDDLQVFLLLSCFGGRPVSDLPFDLLSIGIGPSKNILLDT